MTYYKRLFLALIGLFLFTTNVTFAACNCHDLPLKENEEIQENHNPPMTDKITYVRAGYIIDPEKNTVLKDQLISIRHERVLAITDWKEQPNGFLPCIFKKVLDANDQAKATGPKKDKKRDEAEQEAFRKLWLVGKGTPYNKILKKIKEDPDKRQALDKRDLYYHGDHNKEERLAALSELYMIVDEKGNEYELTDKGINAWQNYTGGVGTAEDFIMMDIGYEYAKIDADKSLDSTGKMARKMAVREEDAKRKERSHNLRQLLRAHLLMEKDVDYIVSNGKIVIIDENTGRTQEGRRFSDGLHQAIEAKEDVEIQKETQTYATITLQNYFRMYEKLSGMTGTAVTEAQEFKEVYKLDVLSIPTHKRCLRKDAHDEIYMTEREKYNAILNAVKEIHALGRPILIGTESVEISEKLSNIFKRNGLPHTVLNAKQNEREAEIVAEAGRKGVITIATNMAGRGTDIKLEPGVAEIGGLHVIGTTRHQARRTDRQLSGRCARQGDPGTAQFYISFEDPLLRLFTSPRITGMLQRFRPDEGEAISARMLDNSVVTAQKRVEQRNYMMRKHTLEYDDVMNKQRQSIYSLRNEILSDPDIEPLACEILESVCKIEAENFFRNRAEEGGWDPEGYCNRLMELFPVTFTPSEFEGDDLEIEEIETHAGKKVAESFRQKMIRENGKVQGFITAPGMVFKPANDASRSIMIRKLDKMWQEHLLHMDHLRSDVSLRSVGQKNPLQEFKHEAFSLFETLSKRLRTEIGRALFKFEIFSGRPNLQPGLQPNLQSGPAKPIRLDITNKSLPELSEISE